MFGDMLNSVRALRPVIHCITNYVTAADCANTLLACGASPVMANDINEVADITSLSNGLVLNIGLLNESSAGAMLISGKKANEIKIPVILDPVGIGASEFRADFVKRLTENVRISVIRGNISEIKFLASKSTSQGVIDAPLSDAVTKENINSAVRIVKELAKKTGAIISATGKTDIISDGEKTFCVFNGHPMMSRITGAGCRLSALTAAFAAANTYDLTEAVACAACAFGLCGEKAFALSAPHDGNAAYSARLTDAVFNLSAQELERGALYEIK